MNRGEIIKINKEFEKTKQEIYKQTELYHKLNNSNLKSGRTDRGGKKYDAVVNEIKKRWEIEIDKIVETHTELKLIKYDVGTYIPVPKNFNINFDLENIKENHPTEYYCYYIKFKENSFNYDGISPSFGINYSYSDEGINFKNLKLSNIIPLLKTYKNTADNFNLDSQWTGFVIKPYPSIKYTPFEHNCYRLFEIANFKYLIQYKNYLKNFIIDELKKRLDSKITILNDPYDSKSELNARFSNGRSYNSNRFKNLYELSAKIDNGIPEALIQMLLSFHFKLEIKPETLTNLNSFMEIEKYVNFDINFHLGNRKHELDHKTNSKDFSEISKCLNKYIKLICAINKNNLKT